MHHHSTIDRPPFHEANHPSRLSSRLSSRLRSRGVSAAAAFLAMLALALTPAAEAASTPTDAWITAKVKISLAATDGVRAGDVNVDTVGRRVTLHGTVHTAAQKEIAEQAAKAIEGTISVRNLLQVVAAKNEEAVEARDDEIRSQVAAALAGEPSIQDSRLAVQSVNKGVVLLKGTATSLDDHLTAVQLAYEIKGVRRVASEAQSGDSLLDNAIWKEANIPVSGPSVRSVRSATNDLYLTSMVKMRLLANAATPAMDINVDTRTGVVTLFGIVPSLQSKDAAEVEARQVSGVNTVRNQLEVVPDGNLPVVQARDDVVQAAVQVNFASHDNLSGVRTEVSNCVARLTGSVATGVERLEAMQVARATPGVCSVRSDITLK